MGWVFNGTVRPLFPQEIAAVPIIQEAEWVPASALTNEENSLLAAPRFETLMPKAIS
jgi:hypothetical protein